MRSNQPSSSDYHSKWGITVSLFMSRAFTFLGVLFFHHKKVNESFIVAKNEELTSLDVSNFTQCIMITEEVPSKKWFRLQPKLR